MIGSSPASTVPLRSTRCRWPRVFTQVAPRRSKGVLLKNALWIASRISAFAGISGTRDVKGMPRTASASTPRPTAARGFNARTSPSRLNEITPSATEWRA